MRYLKSMQYKIDGYLCIKRILKYVPVKMAKTKSQLLYSDSLFDALNFSSFGEKENNQ